MLKNKIKTTSFWLGVGGSVIILLNCLSNLFGIEICADFVEDLVVSFCSVLVMLGIITKKTDNDDDKITKEELISEIENFKNDDNSK